MKYDFDEVICRKGSACYKWDSEQVGDCLPLWVADMDWKAAPPILAAMQRRLDHGVFGYECVPDAYYEAVSNWFSRRHGWHGIRKEQLICTIGVVPALAAVLRAMSRAGDPILMNTPAYNCFFDCINNLETKLIEQPLVVRNNHYEIDFDDFAKKCRKAKIFILCNPHNPTGRIWTREELATISRICEENHVFVVADEIHCEFEFPGEHYTPYATVAQSNNYCILTAASKAFNIAGLQCANIFVPDQVNYFRINHAILTHEIGGVNPFGVEALMAAYNESEDWIDQLNEYIFTNYRYLAGILHEHLPELGVTRMEGTYLAWIDVSAWNISSQQLCSELVQQEHVLFNPAEMYGSDHHIRINMACPRSILQQALERLIDYAKKKNNQTTNQPK